MLVKIGHRPDHGFDEPLGLLSDCHRRIEHFLAILVTLASNRTHLSEHERGVLDGALRYFATAAPRHSADEEESLFPRLKASGDPQAQAALETVQRLEEDHRTADEHHQAVDELGRRWLEAGVLSPDDAGRLREHLEILDCLYRAHIKVEDEELFPAAGRVLGESDLAEVGREMASRRGLSFPSADPR